MTKIIYTKMMIYFTNLNCFFLDQEMGSTNELIGGFNPIYWNQKERDQNDEYYYIETDKGFIFKMKLVTQY